MCADQDQTDQCEEARGVHENAVQKQGVGTVPANKFGARNELPEVPTEFHGDENGVDDDDTTACGKEDGCHDTGVRGCNEQSCKQHTEIDEEIDFEEYKL